MDDSGARPAITPELTVARLLDAYPELEDTLVGIAPAFARLRSPLLRRTVARLTSLRQASAVGGVPLGSMIRTLRAEAGMEEPWMADSAEGTSPASRPEWLVESACVEVFDTRGMIEKGEVPMPRVMAALERLRAGEVYTLVTPFPPAPLIDRMREAGYRVWTEQVAPEECRTCCSRGAES